MSSAGRFRVLITRSPHQASELAGRLRALGAQPILIPAIEITEPTSFAALDTALAHPETFHWLLFTSANAVEAFHCRLQSPQPRVPRVSMLRRGSGSPRIAAIGPSTARALEAIGLSVDLLPTQAVAESLTSSLLPHARQSDGSPTRFLLIRAEEAREQLPEALRAAGAGVTIAPAYRTIVPSGSIPAIRDLFQQRLPHPRSGVPEQGGVLSSQLPPAPIDAITFTSSSSVRNLIALCAAAGVTLPPNALRISIGPITTQTLRELGYPPHAESLEATTAALAEATLHALHERAAPSPRD
jgi:uroporphyrinogen-III synthase